MQRQLSTIIRSEMKSQGFSRADVVRRMGYKNISKGMRRMDGWLKGETYPNASQCTSLAGAVSVDVETLIKAILTDKVAARAERRRRRAQDPQYYLTIRLMAAVYNQLTLPADLSRSEAIEHGAHTAIKLRRRCCLDMPSSETVWFEADGSYAIRVDTAPPYMSVGGKRFVLG